MTMNNKFASMHVADEDDVPQVVVKKTHAKKAEAPKKQAVKRLGGNMGDDGFEAIDK